jgi:hypothetical protein
MGARTVPGSYMRCTPHVRPEDFVTSHCNSIANAYCAWFTAKGIKWRYQFAYIPRPFSFHHTNIITVAAHSEIHLKSPPHHPPRSLRAHGRGRLLTERQHELPEFSHHTSVSDPTSASSRVIRVSHTYSFNAILLL